MALSTPKIDEIRAQLLKLGDNKPLGTIGTDPGIGTKKLAGVSDAWGAGAPPGQAGDPPGITFSCRVFSPYDTNREPNEE